MHPHDESTITFVSLTENIRTKEPPLFVFETMPSSFSDRLRRFDVNSTVEESLKVHTWEGAIVAMVTLVLILYFIITEAYFNFQVVTTDTVYVNATNNPAGVELEFDMTLIDIPCSQLSIDANDPTGQSQSLHLDQTHHIWKHRVLWKNNKKTLLGSKQKIELGSTLLSLDDLDVELPQEGAAVEPEEPDCGDCFGAGEEGECCNTCDDVERAYKRKGWVLNDLQDIPQCKQKHFTKLQKNEGCNVHGKVALSTGGGNLHLAPSKDAFDEKGHKKEQLISMLDLLMGQLQQWNVSHVVHKLRFGPEYPEAVYQLDGQTRSIEDTYGMYQYYFQVVPTTYVFLNGTVIQTNQYSVTEHLRHVDFGSARGLPGVFFFYEVSPLHVLITESYRKGWVAFGTSVCAVVGGVVTVMGMLDQYLFRSKRGMGGLAR